jgi:hypothetical protein
MIGHTPNDPVRGASAPGAKATPSSCLMQLAGHEVHGHKPHFIYIGPTLTPATWVTSQMTLDARGTRMTLTGWERASRLTKSMVGIS